MSRYRPSFSARRPRARRRGGTTAGLLVTLSILGALGAAAVMVTPGYLHASGGGIDDLAVAARTEEHQRVIDLLAEMIGRSREVLLVSPRDASPYLEIVLWLADEENIGRIDAAEVAVLSHSEVLQTIAFHSIDAAAAGGRDGGAGGPSLLRRMDVRRPGFCAAWRVRPDVSRRVIAGTVAGFTLEPLPAAPGEARGRLRLSLTWAQESADGPDEASVVVDAPMTPGAEGG